MTTDLEHRLRTALHHDAGRAPLAAPTWDERPYVAAAPLRRRWSLVATAAAAGLLVFAGVAAIQRSEWSRPSSRARPRYLQGREFAVSFVDTAPDLPDLMLAKPGSVSVLRLPDRPELMTVYTAAMWWPIVQPTECAIIYMGGGCGDTGGPPAFSLGGETDDSKSVWYPATWGPLPTGTAYVQFVDADGVEWWQSPLARVAVFPNPGGREPRSYAAFDEGGRLLASDTNPGVDTRARPDRPVERAVDVQAAGDTTMKACLTAAGATITDGSPVPLFRPGIDGAAVWDRCFAEGKAAVERRNAELGG